MTTFADKLNQGRRSMEKWSANMTAVAKRRAALNCDTPGMEINAMTRKIDDGGPAYPQLEVGNCDQRGITYFSCGVQHEGLSLRDYFAAAALQGLLANRTFELFTPDGNELFASLAASNCYELADAMLAARQGANP